MLYEEAKEIALKTAPETAQSVELIEEYGPFKSHRPYKLVGEKRDWLRLKCRGNLYFVPKLYEERKKKYSHKDLPTYEEIIEETIGETVE